MFGPIQKFRQHLDAGNWCVGVGVTLSDPAVTEALGPSVDFFWIDLEHNPTGLESLLAHLIAARATQTPAIVRVPNSEPGFMKRVLDTGADSIAVPQVRSAEEVQQVVDTCRYPPLGRRGSGPRRASNYGRERGATYMDEADASVYVVVQVENTEAFEDLDNILAVKGLDSVMIGPYDFANSMGKRGDISDPEVQAAFKSIVERSRKAGIPVGMGMGSVEEHALDALRIGVQWVQCGCDYTMMLDRTDEFVRNVREGFGTR